MGGCDVQRLLPTTNIQPYNLEPDPGLASDPPTFPLVQAQMEDDQETITHTKDLLKGDVGDHRFPGKKTAS